MIRIAIFVIILPALTSCVSKTFVFTTEIDNLGIAATVAGDEEAVMLQLRELMCLSEK